MPFAPDPSVYRTNPRFRPGAVNLTALVIAGVKTNATTKLLALLGGNCLKTLLGTVKLPSLHAAVQIADPYKELLVFTEEIKVTTSPFGSGEVQVRFKGLDALWVPVNPRLVTLKDGDSVRVGDVKAPTLAPPDPLRV